MGGGGTLRGGGGLWGGEECANFGLVGGIPPHPPVGKPKAPLPASQSVNRNHFFSKIADRIFIKFHTNFWFLMNKKVVPPRKNHFGKKSEISKKV